MHSAARPPTKHRPAPRPSFSSGRQHRGNIREIPFAIPSIAPIFPALDPPGMVPAAVTGNSTSLQEREAMLIRNAPQPNIK